MELLAGLVTLANFVLAGVVGVRLVRRGARTRGPERWLGVHFLTGPMLSTLLAGVLYMSFADPTRALPERLLPPVHAVDLVLANVGSVCVFLFTWRTFRPDARWAPPLVAGAAAVLAGSWLAYGLLEGFALRVLNGPAYWAAFPVRVGGLAWAAAESLRYGGLLRRRVALGLADPLVADRFRLWGVWAVCALLMAASDPLGRIWYWWITGTTTTWHPEIGRPIVVAMMAATCAIGLVGAGSLFLTFFPTARYRRWVARRAPAASASA